MNYSNLNYNKLKKDLVDYYGTAIYSGFPMAIIDVYTIERMSNDEMIKVAKKIGFKMDKYRIV